MILPHCAQATGTTGKVEDQGHDQHLNKLHRKLAKKSCGLPTCSNLKPASNTLLPFNFL